MARLIDAAKREASRQAEVQAWLAWLQPALDDDPEALFMLRAFEERVGGVAGPDDGERTLALLADGGAIDALHDLLERLAAAHSNRRQ